MKKLFAAVLIAASLSLTAVPAFAVTATYVCPNGNTACVENGACLTNGSCVDHDNCVINGTCQYPEGCPNGGVPKRDGTGSPNGVRRGGHHRSNGTGHCGRNRT